MTLYNTGRRVKIDVRITILLAHIGKAILQEMDRDWRKAYSDFWEEERRLEDEISKKYGLEDRDDFFRKWEMYQEGSACK